MLIGLAAGRGLEEPTSSEALCRSAFDHRMAGLVWGEVRAGRARLSDSWRKRLAHYALEVRLSQRQLRSQLAAVSGRIDSIGVDIATFKGVIAAERWYASPSDRPCADIDLLLAPHHRERADEVLAALDPNHPLLDRILRIVRRRLLPSVDVWLEDGTMVDLHFDLLKYEVPDRCPELLWSQTYRYPLADDVAVHVLKPELALLQLLVNLNRDRFRYLLGFADVARLLAKEDLDWDLFARLVRAEGLDVPVALSLEAVCATLGLPPPSAPSRAWLAGDAVAASVAAEGAVAGRTERQPLAQPPARAAVPCCRPRVRGCARMGPLPVSAARAHRPSLPRDGRTVSLAQRRRPRPTRTHAAARQRAAGRKPAMKQSQLRPSRASVIAERSGGASPVGGGCRRDARAIVPERFGEPVAAS